MPNGDDRESTAGAGKADGGMFADSARILILVAFSVAIAIAAIAAICELDARYSKPRPREAIPKEAYVRLVEECMAKNSRTDETGWCISRIRETFTTDAAEGGTAGR